MKCIKVSMVFYFLCIYTVGQSQKAIPVLKPSVALNEFVKSLTVIQLDSASRPYDDKQRTNWDFVPRTDRTGITLGSLSPEQVDKFYRLVVATAGETTLEKIKNAAFLEGVLRGVEGRPENDTYRDPKKYFIQVFGLNQMNKVWGWKYEGHHICLNYVIKDDKVVSASPSIYSSNPAIVLAGPNQGKQILKTETQLAADLLFSLNAEQKAKTIISAETPKEIYTYKERTSTVNTPGGILFSELNTSQQAKLKELVTFYVTRASKFFVKDMLDRIEKSGWDKVRFSWAGSEDVTVNHPNYYSVQSPEFLIEYDNYQNNGNHVHSIFRDVKNDFGDALAEHLKKEH
ncbi:MAG: DUF3500 domain-containing protein [Saprospiraceae bacterium]